MKNEIVLSPVYYASVSGGKDSLYMLKLILSHPERYKLDGVVHFELEIDFPFIKEVIDYMERECKKYGIPFYRISPRTKWIDLYNKYGFPSYSARWCNGQYKLDCKKQLNDWEKSNNHKVIYYIGYCYDEISRFKDNDDIYPLVDFGIKEETVLVWAKTVSLFNDYYLINKRCGCMYCPMQSLITCAYIKVKYPKEYDLLMKYALDTEYRLLAEKGIVKSVWGGDAKYDTLYRMDIIERKYEPKVRFMLLKQKRGEQ